MRAFLVVVGVSLLAATAALAQTANMTPEQGIAAAAANPEGGVTGTFEFIVQSVGDAKSAKGAIIYLNSETDYRAPTNISAMIMPLTATSLQQTLGGPLKEHLVGRRVAITGTAKQTRIDFLDERTGKRVGQYYFQTRISVRGADRVRIF